jgi:predicted glycosyltransferase involved in capsule biosynthesis
MDIIYLVCNLDDKAIQRFKNSINSFNKTEHNIIISDTSKDNNTRLQIDIANIPYNDYIFNPSKTKFNRSRTINKAVEQSVKSKMFGVFDIDLIFPLNFIKDTISNDKLYIRNKLVYLPENETSINYNILNKKYNRSLTAGSFFISTKIFKEVNGFDENYVGWGAEDSDFSRRIEQHIPRQFIHINTNILTYHQWHPDKSKIETKEKTLNLQYYNKQRQLYLKKDLLYCKNGIKK